MFDSDAELVDLLASSSVSNGFKTLKLSVKLADLPPSSSSTSLLYPVLPVSSYSAPAVAAAAVAIPLNDMAAEPANDADLEVMLRTLATNAVPSSPSENKEEDDDHLSMVEVTPDMIVVDDASSLASSSNHSAFTEQPEGGMKQRKGKAPAVAAIVENKSAQGTSSTSSSNNTSSSSSYSSSQFAAFVAFFQNLLTRHPELVSNVRRVLAQIISTVGAASSHIYVQLQTALEEGYSRALRHFQLQRYQHCSNFTREDARRFTTAALSAAETSVRAAAPYIHQGVANFHHSVAMTAPLVQRGVAMATPLVQQGFTFAVDGLQSLTRRVVGGSGGGRGDLNVARERYSHMAFQRRNSSNSNNRVKLEDLAYAGKGGSYPLYYPGSSIPAVPTSSQAGAENNTNTGQSAAQETLPRYSPPTHPAPFHTQMQMLTSMGFIDMELNLALLEQCNGDVHRVIEFLSS